MNLQLDGKTALVTGSTLGIGFAIARALAGEGARVTVNGRTDTRVTEAVARLRAEVPAADVTGVAADLATADGVARLVAIQPDVDILVNNLGIFEPKAFEEITDADWLRFFEVNVMSGVRLARRYLPRMKARNWGRVVFISSESAINIPAEMIHYGMTKSAQTFGGAWACRDDRGHGRNRQLGAAGTDGVGGRREASWVSSPRIEASRSRTSSASSSRARGPRRCSSASSGRTRWGAWSPTSAARSPLPPTGRRCGSRAGACGP